MIGEAIRDHDVLLRAFEKELRIMQVGFKVVIFLRLLHSDVGASYFSSLPSNT